MFILISFRVNKILKKKLEEGSFLFILVKDGDNFELDFSSFSKLEYIGKNNLNKCLFCGVVYKLDNCIDFCRMFFS